MSNLSIDDPQLPKSAWDGNPPQGAAARARLLEATCRCIDRDGLASTSIAAVAAEAGVSRQTVYRYFSGRDELAKRAIFGRAEALREKITSQVALLADPADVIVEALVLGLAEIRSDRVLRAIWDSASPDGLVAEIFTHPVGIAWMGQAMARAIELAGWNQSAADSAMEFVLRVGLSLLITQRAYSLILFHVAGWYLFAAYQFTRHPPKCPPDGWWTWMRSTATGFKTLHIAMVAVLIAIGLVWTLGLHQTPYLAWLLAPESFLYWTIMHITISFVPR